MSECTETADDCLRAVDWKKVGVFYAATFVLTHGLSLVYVATGGNWRGPSSFVVANLLMLSPGIVAVVMQRFWAHEPIRSTLALRVRLDRWFIVAWLLPPVISMGALGLSLLLPGAAFAPEMSGLPPEMEAFKQQVSSLPMPPFAAMLALGLVLGPSANAVGGLGEELGWRGFLFKELAPLGFWKSSLLTGLFWALWHVPTILQGYHDMAHPWASAAGMLTFAILLSPILALIRLRSGSVVACAVFHGTMSSTRLISVGFVRDAGPWSHAAIPAVLLLLIAPLLLSRRLASSWLSVRV